MLSGWRRLRPFPCSHRFYFPVSYRRCHEQFPVTRSPSSTASSSSPSRPSLPGIVFRHLPSHLLASSVVVLCCATKEGNVRRNRGLPSGPGCRLPRGSNALFAGRKTGVCMWELGRSREERRRGIVDAQLPVVGTRGSCKPQASFNVLSPSLGIISSSPVIC